MSELQTVRVAAVQAEPFILDRDATVTKACNLIGEAGANGAQLVVFPEAFISTYVNGSIWGRGLAPGEERLFTPLGELGRDRR